MFQQEAVALSNSVLRIVLWLFPYFFSSTNISQLFHTINNFKGQGTLTPITASSIQQN